MKQSLSAQEATARLSSVFSLFNVATGAFGLLTQEPARSELSKFVIRYDDRGEFQVTKDAPRPAHWVLSSEVKFYDVDYRHHALALLERFKRQAIIESFDVVRQFANYTPAWEELAQEPWFHFTLFYRHAVAHDGRWRFNASDKKKLPASFMNLKIDESMEGRSIEGFLDLFRASNLLKTMHLFVDGHRGRS